MTWLREQADGEQPLDRVFGLSPVVYEQYRELVRHVWQPGLISPVLLELCRLRMAQLIGGEHGFAGRAPQAAEAGLSDEKVAALRQWPTSPLFDAAERACLAFAESYVIDAHSVTDGQCAELQRHLSPSEVAVLTTALALFDATARFEVALGVHDPSERS
jgi:alkylhydroperoxidase family enzyme